MDDIFDYPYVYPIVTGTVGMSWWISWTHRQTSNLDQVRQTVKFQLQLIVVNKSSGSSTDVKSLQYISLEHSQSPLELCCCSLVPMLCRQTSYGPKQCPKYRMSENGIHPLPEHIRISRLRGINLEKASLAQNIRCETYIYVCNMKQYEETCHHITINCFPAYFVKQFGDVDSINLPQLCKSLACRCDMFTFMTSSSRLRSSFSGHWFTWMSGEYIKQ